MYWQDLCVCVWGGGGGGDQDQKQIYGVWDRQHLLTLPADRDLKWRRPGHKNHHATPRHATPRHDTTYHDTTRHATPRHDTTCHTTTRHATPPTHTISYRLVASHERWKQIVTFARAGSAVTNTRAEQRSLPTCWPLQRSKFASCRARNWMKSVSRSENATWGGHNRS